ncbi:hypothetical protein [Rhodococcus koreensis]|uniref:Uncharacterized protein n=1 Tax=Rhodococcus koreensis TaxID=99653 RepID=A0A1H5C6Z1_9NOCA|nr:hypothetical protein [Rhodococcus koreensis]SED62406.1 hypothetical protein SAMN04490239_9036 [Rhodococcus koreensis]
MTRIRRRSAVALASIAGASSLLLAACTQDASSTDGTESVAPSASSEPPSAEPAVNGVDAKQYASSDPESDAFGFVTPSGKWLCAIIPDKKLAGCASHPTAGPLGVPGTPQIASPDGGPPAEADLIAVEAGKEPNFQNWNEALFPGNANVLPYDTTLAVDGFSCNVQFSGVSCREDATGKGFTVATNGYKFEFTPLPVSIPSVTPPPIAPTAAPLPQQARGSNQCGPVTYPETGKPATVVIVKGTLRCDEAHTMLTKYFTGRDKSEPVYSFDGWECRLAGDPESAEIGYTINCTDDNGNTVVAQP